MRTSRLILPLLVLANWFCSSEQSLAQCDSLLQAATTAGGFQVARLASNGTDTVYSSPDAWAPRFVFTYEADSSYSTWSFSEFLVNRRKLMLNSWCAKRTVNYDFDLNVAVENWNPATMRANSVTRPFMLRASDTIQFYRHYSWMDRLTMDLSFNRYVNSNGLSFSVELVQSSNGTRIALLDTCSFATTTSNRKPSIYTWFPAASIVRYFVASDFDSTQVYIRVNTWTSGSNPQPFSRYDGIGKMQSAEHLVSTEWKSYNDSLRVNSTTGSTCGFTVGSSQSPKSLLISHGSTPAFDEMKIVDIFGVEYWSASAPLSSMPVQVNLSTGFYIVVALSNGNVACTKQVYLP